jgi:nitrile hydratase beta subunit
VKCAASPTASHPAIRFGAKGDSGMNGIHDMGGMDGFGPVVRETGEPVFHAAWEGRMFAITNLLIGQGLFNVDEFRHAIERIPAPRYLDSTYYERWLDAVQTLLAEKRAVSREEMERCGAAPNPPSQPATVSAKAAAKPGKAVAARLRAKFRAGDRVLARNLNPSGHTRLARYARAHRGVIHRDHGIYVFPDTNAHGGPPRHQHVYSVVFKASELWGANAPRRENVYIDLWEDYLASDTKPPARRAHKKPKPARKRR